MLVGQSNQLGEHEKGSYKDMFGALFVITNAAINLSSMVLSLILHPFFYEQNRTWFREHRLSSGVGVALVIVASVINRQIFRLFTSGEDNANTQYALDVAAATMGILSVATGVLQADMLREAHFTEEEQG